MKLIFVHSCCTFSIPTDNQGCGFSFSECKSTVLTIGQKSKTFSGEKVNKGTNLPFHTYLYRTVQYPVTVSVAEPPLFLGGSGSATLVTFPTYQCFGSGSAWIRIIGGLMDVDPDPHGQIRIRIQEVKSSEIKLKIAATYNSE